MRRDSERARSANAALLRSGVRLLCALGLLTLCGATRAAPLEWQPETDGRSAALPVHGPGKTGFTLLAPSATGINFTNVLSKEAAAENQIRLNGSGVAAGDVDGDGWCDLYFCGLQSGNRLFRNLGGWHFVDITEEAGAACTNQFSTGAVFADVDGDGDLDLLVNGIGAGTRLFINDGRGHFTESTNSGLFGRFGSMSMALADIDGDGALDLYVANYRTNTIRSTGLAVLNVGGKRMIRPEDRGSLEYTPEGLVLEHGEIDVLYHNDGHGHFKPIRWTDGAYLDEDGKPLTKPPREWGLTVAFRDLNGDLAPDIYVCNDFQSPDRVWINDGHGRFRALPPKAIRHTPTFSMAVDFGDLDRDGHDDFLTLDMLERGHGARLQNVAMSPANPPAIGEGSDRPQIDRNTLQHNRGDGTYADLAQYAGLEATGWSWSLIFLDVDLDGFEDVLFTAGNMFNTQDLDANARIAAHGPFRREMIPAKLLMYPPLSEPKVLFRNRGDLTFEEVSSQWGFSDVGVCQGMALVDLDNDGDLDVVVNNLNGPAGIYRNETSAPRVAVRLKGLPPNTRGIGAKIKLLGGPVPQSQEMICGGRYLSCDDAMRVFAAGQTGRDLSIEVAWRSGRKSVIHYAKANRVYELDEALASAASATNALPDQPVRPLFEDVSARLHHTHHEEMFDDFVRQPLLPRKLSQLGPGVSWFDWDGDGWEDLIIGSGKGGHLGVYRNDRQGGFTPVEDVFLQQVVTRDQTGVLGWRKTNAQAVLLAGSANYEDGLPIGPAVRQYDRASKTIDDSLPGQAFSTGPLAMADIAGDGTLELFVGGRSLPGQYPAPASSLLLRNQAGKWVLDDKNTAVLKSVGLVSGAVWSDLDNDGLPELILACEWGPLRVFHYQAGQLHEITKEWGLDQYPGWWTSVAAGDFNGDGQMDLVAGNWGLNTPARASAQLPLRLYYGDIDGNGTLDLVEAHLDQPGGRWFPDRDLNSIRAAMPFLTEKFSSHRAYSEATLPEIYGEKLASTKVLEVTTLASMVFLNRGRRFEAVSLPREAQFAPAFGIAVADFDGDGAEDVILSENFFATQPQIARHDAGRGLFLKGDGSGHFKSVRGQESGIEVYGEQRGCAAADYDHDGRVDLVVTQNGADTILLHNQTATPGLSVRLVGPAGNPQGIGAVLRLSFGERSGALREVHAGGGYWSQDSAIQVMATPIVPSALEVRWPGGRKTHVQVPIGARAIEVNMDGKVTALNP